jgi:hypothetical protein
MGLHPRHLSQTEEVLLLALHAAVLTVKPSPYPQAE